MTWPERLAVFGWVLWFRGKPVILWLLVCAVLAVFAVIGSIDQSTRQRQLLALNKQLAANHHWDEQRYVLLQLLEMDPRNADLRYQFAQNLAQHGESSRTARIMAELAPANQVGHPGAHAWQAGQFKGLQRPLSTEETATLRFHLEQALLAPEHAGQAHQELARLAFRGKRWESAIEHLQQLPANQPENQAALGVAYRQLGRKPQADDAAEKSIRLGLARLDEDASDHAARLLAAEQMLALGRDVEALKLLEDGQAVAPDPRYGPRISQVCLRLAGLLPSASPLSPRQTGAFEIARALALLQKALHHAPRDPIALEALAKLSLVQSPEADQARNLLRDLLASGAAPPVVHLILGTSAVLSGETTAATLHLEQAYRLDSKLTAAANNLAYYLAHATPPQFERALELVNSAIEVDANHPEFRDTRGEILLALNRPQDALVDLELALRAFPKRSPLHRQLADVYRRLGDESQAARHGTLAQSLKVHPDDATTPDTVDTSETLRQP